MGNSKKGPIRSRWQAVFFTALVGLGACTSPAVERVVAIPTPVSGKYQELLVKPFESDKISEGARRNLAWEVRKKLLQAGVFRTVSLGREDPQADSSTLVLVGTITEFIKGDGSIFGSPKVSEVGGTFELLDPEGNVVLQFSASTFYTSNSGLLTGGARSPSLEDLLEQLAATTADRIVRWIKGKPMGGNP